jgi:hypothetical protein
MEKKSVDASNNFHEKRIWFKLFAFAVGLACSWVSIVTEPSNYNGPHIPVIVVMTSDSRTYVPRNLKDLLSSEQDLITGVLQYYNRLFKIPSE